MSRPSTPPPSDGAGRDLPYYSRREVAQHNVLNDCWLSYFGKVYDLTPVVKENPGLLVEPLVQFAGQDITHWFDPKTKQPKTHISPLTGVRQCFTPSGRFLHIPPPEPTANWDNSFDVPWWEDQRLQVGFLSRATRRIRILNLLSGQSDVLEVCAEDRLRDIRQRYLSFNRHALSYTWKRLGRVLNMDLTLADNGVPDDADELDQLNLDEQHFLPELHVYFNDDLTVD